MQSFHRKLAPERFHSRVRNGCREGEMFPFYVPLLLFISRLDLEDRPALGRG